MSLSNLFGSDGLLSEAISGYAPRESQLQMSEAIHRALSVEAELVIEAGTGTGKTFGYLMPIFLTQKKNHHLNRYKKFTRSIIF